MALGNGFFTPNPTIDIDAYTFIATRNITGNSKKTALSSLVNALKNLGIWGKLDVIYPFVGGTSTTHSYNLKSVSQYQISWNGTVTHNSDGITRDGVTGYGNTGYSIPSPLTDIHVSVYIKNNIISSNNQQPFGAYAIGTSDSLIGIRLIDSPSTITTFLAGGPFFYLENNSQNFYSINRAKTVFSYYKNSTHVNSVTITDRDDNTLPIYLLGANFYSSSLLKPGTFNLAFFTTGKSLTATDDLNLYNIIQTFQTALEREN